MGDCGIDNAGEAELKEREICTLQQGQFFFQLMLLSFEEEEGGG